MLHFFLSLFASLYEISVRLVKIVCSYPVYLPITILTLNIVFREGVYRIFNGGGLPRWCHKPTPFIKSLFIGAPNFIQKVGWWQRLRRETEERSKVHLIKEKKNEYFMDPLPTPRHHLNKVFLPPSLHNFYPPKNISFLRPVR